MGTVGAARLLNQGTFGANLVAINTASTMTAAQWVAQQIAIPPSSMVAVSNSTIANTNGWLGSKGVAFWNLAVQAPDQLRQRVAWELLNIMVVEFSADQDHVTACLHYWDTLANNAFSNFSTLLTAVSTSFAMGIFLNAFRSPAATLPAHADENYAREIQQLFSIGLWMLNPDGSLQLDANSNPIPTYTQAEIGQMAKVFTGWASAPQTHTGDQAFLYDYDETKSMVPYDDYHDKSQKTILSGVVLAANQNAATDLAQTIQTITNHQNVGPFIGKQLIQKLVTSNPSPAYVANVSAAYANDGTGVRGNMGAVVTAILTDPEATNPSGKLREPVLEITHLWRAFNAATRVGDVYDYDVNQNLITYAGQAPWDAPSVFNFDRPDYIPPGPLTTANLYGPEFQMLNESTIANMTNYWDTITGKWKNSANTTHTTEFDPTSNNGINGTQTQEVYLNTATWESLATNIPALIAQFNLVFFNNTMSPAYVTALTNYANTLAGQSPWLIVTQVANMIMKSPQYAIQR